MTVGLSWVVFRELSFLMNCRTHILQMSELVSVSYRVLSFVVGFSFFILSLAVFTSLIELFTEVILSIQLVTCILL